MCLPFSNVSCHLCMFHRCCRMCCRKLCACIVVSYSVQYLAVWWCVAVHVLSSVLQCECALFAITVARVISRGVVSFIWTQIWLVTRAQLHVELLARLHLSQVVPNNQLPHTQLCQCPRWWTFVQVSSIINSIESEQQSEFWECLPGTWIVTWNPSHQIRTL